LILLFIPVADEIKYLYFFCAVITTQIHVAYFIIIIMQEQAIGSPTLPDKLFNSFFRIAHPG